MMRIFFFNALYVGSAVEKVYAIKKSSVRPYGPMSYRLAVVAIAEAFLIRRTLGADLHLHGTLSGVHL
jgi:uncharacterized membrane protein